METNETRLLVNVTPYDPRQGEEGRADWSTPVAVTVSPRGVSLTLGSHEDTCRDAPDVFVERRLNGWAIVISPDGGDATCVAYILDSGKTVVVPDQAMRDCYRTEVADRPPAEIDKEPAPAA